MGVIIERDYAGYPKLMGRLSQYTLAAQQEDSGAHNQTTARGQGLGKWVG